MRRHRLLKPLLIGLALCWAFPVSASVDPVATKKELQQIQNRIQDLQKDIKRTQSRRSATKQRHKAAQDACGMRSIPGHGREGGSGYR